ncbi:hypothetical protein N8687_00860 [bacterium]|nr:hypothetical protein [bacterium]
MVLVEEIKSPCSGRSLGDVRVINDIQKFNNIFSNIHRIEVNNNKTPQTYQDTFN